MSNLSKFFDYFIVIQLVAAILYFAVGHNKYEGVIVYFSAIIFVAYWIIKIIFSKACNKNKEKTKKKTMITP